MDRNKVEDTGDGREPVREFQLEGSLLYLVSALLILLLVGAFFLGRWYERSGSSSSANTPSTGTSTLFSNGVSDAEPPKEEAVEATTDFFDTIPGEGANAEPEREAQGSVEKPKVVEEPAVELPSPAGIAQESGPADGPFYVQVTAVRDRKAAVALKSTLDRQGYRCRIYTASDASGPLYKVQVGGFPDKEAAGDTVANLEKAGYKGVWTTRVD